MKAGPSEAGEGGPTAPAGQMASPSHRFSFWKRKSTVLSLGFLGLLATAALADDWPFFRDPSHQAESTEKDLPLQWGSTANIAWKTPIPGQGWSSPIVSGNRVFITTDAYDGASCHVLCLDRRDGRILWDKETCRQTLKRKEGKNRYATSTPVTDGRHVHAVFADGSFAALTSTLPGPCVSRLHPVA